MSKQHVKLKRLTSSYVGWMARMNVRAPECLTFSVFGLQLSGCLDVHSVNPMMRQWLSAAVGYRDGTIR